METKRFQLGLVLNKLELGNFRGFEALSLEFHSKLTVIIGENGSGKTTILDGLAALLRLITNDLQRNENVEWAFFLEEDIRNTALEMENGLEFILSEQVLKLGVRLGRMQSGYHTAQMEVLDSYKNAINKKTTELSQAVAQNQSISLPVIVYYSFNQVPQKYSYTPNGKKYKSELLSIYDDALTGKSFDYLTVHKWLAWQYNKSGQKVENNELLATVCAAIYSVLSDEYSVFDDLHFNFDNQDDEKIMIRKNGQILSVNQFSSGEKTIFSLVADLARRLAIANPRIEKPLQQSGIVLIDEIDLHLHPRWQRKIIPALLKTFPNIQWVVTTHSPQVLGEVKGEQRIYISENQKVRLLDFNTYGKDSNRLLNRIMGVSERNETILKQLDKYFELIELNEWNSEEALKLRTELEKEMGTDEPLFRRADGIIQRKILIGR